MNYKILTETFPIVNNGYALTKITTIPIKQPANENSETQSASASSATENFIKNNFSELLFNNIIKSFNAILSKKNIIKMPIAYHNNIYIVQHTTECPINRIKHLNFNHTTSNFYIKYDSTNPKSHFSGTLTSQTANTEPLTIHFSKNELLDNNIMYPIICNYIFKKSNQIITTLNNQLIKYNIKIKKASMPFCILNGYKEMIRSYHVDSEMLLDIIFLKPIVNIFDMF